MSKLITTFQPNGLGISAVSDSSLSFKTVTSATATETASLSSTGVFTATSFTGSGTGLTAGTTPLTTLDIDGATDIGADIVDADLLIIDDGAGGTNRKVAASRLKTYISAGGATALTSIDIDGGTDIGAAIVDADLFIVDDGAGGTNRKTAASRLKTYLLADNSIDSDMYVDGSIDTAHLGDLQVTTAKIAADGITSAKIVDDAIDSEHYVDGSIDTAHIADDAVTLAKMASGTDGNIISYDASGNPVAIATGTDGQVLTSTGAGSPPAFETGGGGGFQSCQYFSSSGTWTKPSGITTIIAYVTGAGGGGGYYWGGGGGGGGTAIKKIDVTSISSVTVTIGNGGAQVSSQQASAGGTTSFGSHCSATGGTGGGPHGHVNQAYPGIGGVGSSGDINLPGQGGGSGDEGTNGGAQGGTGGSTYWGGGIQGKHEHGSATNTSTNHRVAGVGEGGYIANTPYGGGYGVVVVEEYK